MRELYEGLLRIPSLSPRMQERILSHARSVQDTDLLLRLLSRVDLSPEVDLDLSEDTSVPVRTAWLSRPGRSASAVETALASEKRIAVLEVVAGLPATTDSAVFEALADRDSPRLARALLRNASAPTSARLKAATTWGRSYRGESVHTARAASEELVPGRALASAAVLSTSNLFLLQALASRDLNSQARERVLKEAVALYEEELRSGMRQEDARTWRRQPRTSQGLWTSGLLLEAPGLSDELRSELVSLYKRKDALGAKEDGRDVKGAVAAQREQLLASARAYRGRERSLRSEKESALVFEAASLPASELRTLVKKAKSSSALATAILSNPRCPLELVSDLMGPGHRHPVDQSKIVVSGSLEVVAEVLARSPRSLSVIGLHSDPSRLLLEVVRRTPRSNSALLNALMTLPWVTEELLLELPLSVLAARYSAPTHVFELYSRHLHMVLEDREDRWEVFDTLSRSFEGSVSELLETVRVLAP